jgi:proteasome-associated ATPase
MSRHERGRRRQSENEAAEQTFFGEPLDEDEDGDGEFDLPETQIEADAVADELLQLTPRDDPRWGALYLLRHQLRVDRQQRDEAVQAIVELQGAYEKLTSPANRVATFLELAEDGVARIALGDNEFYARVDPKLDTEGLDRGGRVRVNDAYAVVGLAAPSIDGAIVKVAETLGDDRLRVGSEPAGTSSRVVMRGPALAELGLHQGDEVRLDPTGRVAVEPFAKAENRDLYFEKVPEIPWSRVGGQEEAIRLIRDVIELPLLHPELYERFGKRHVKGILLYGPPGCGKTLLGKATAYNLTREYARRLGHEVQEYFMYISGPRILNMWLGESERMVREIFATARERAREGHLVFIFIDEAESLLRTRGAGRGFHIANTLVPQFSAEMDGLVALENVVVMLTSNRPDYIDPAILRPERIDRKVKIGRPGREAARDIFGIYLAEPVPIDPALAAERGGDEPAREGLIDQCIGRLFAKAKETEFLKVHLVNGRIDTLHWQDLLSGALIMSVVERAKDYAIQRSIERESLSEGIGEDDLRRAIECEFRENEIFPKSEALEDWLKLIDYDPENVAAIRPVRPAKGTGAARRRAVI